jgi:hypothetical protein
MPVPCETNPLELDADVNPAINFKNGAVSTMSSRLCTLALMAALPPSLNAQSPWERVKRSLVAIALQTDDIPLGPSGFDPYLEKKYPQQDTRTAIKAMLEALRDIDSLRTGTPSSVLVPSGQFFNLLTTMRLGLSISDMTSILNESGTSAVINDALTENNKKERALSLDGVDLNLSRKAPATNGRQN